jgi:hypothetical protein
VGCIAGGKLVANAIDLVVGCQWIRLAHHYELVFGRSRGSLFVFKPDDGHQSAGLSTTVKRGNSTVYALPCKSQPSLSHWQVVVKNVIMQPQDGQGISTDEGRVTASDVMRLMRFQVSFSGIPSGNCSTTDQNV